GRYSYDYNDPFRVFVSSTRAHNTVSVNGGNYPWWGDFNKEDFYRGAVSYYHGDCFSAKLSVEKKFEKPDVLFSRSFSIVRGKSLEVSDRIIGVEKNVYEQWFHFSVPFEYEGEGKGGCLIFSDKRIRVSVVPPKGSISIVVNGQREPYYQGWVSFKEKEVIPRYS